MTKMNQSLKDVQFLKSVYAVPSENNNRIVGTAFVLDSEFLLTCCHVLFAVGCRVELNAKLRVQSAQSLRDNGNPDLATEIAWLPFPSEELAEHCLSVQDDIAVLRLLDKQQAVHPIIPAQMPGAAAPRIRAFGFDAASENNGTWVDGRVIGFGTSGLAQIDTTSNAKIDRGFSGGPVVALGTTKVVAMIAAGKGSDSGVSYALPMERIVDRIDDSKIVGNLHVVNLSASFESLGTMRQIRRRIETRLSKLTGSKSFAVKAKEFPNFNSLRTYLREHHIDDKEYESCIDPKQLLSETKCIRVYLKAPGGFGKTIFLYHFALESLRNNRPTFLIDVGRHVIDPNLSKPEEILYELFECQEEFDDFKKACAFYISNQETARPILIIDGLNETIEAFSVLSFLFAAIDEGHFGDIDLIVSDRMIDRQIECQNVILLGIVGMPEGKIVNFVGKDFDWLTDESGQRIVSAKLARFLSNPFFLDLLINLRKEKKYHKSIITRSILILQYFTRAIADNDRDGDDLKSMIEKIKPYAEAAFEIYRINGSRTFDGKKFIEILSTNLGVELGKTQIIYDRWAAYGLLEPIEEGRVLFRHQLFHDFLAGVYLASIFDPDTSMQRSFQIATLEQFENSESLEIASELLGQPGLFCDDANATNTVDRFVIAVYDWQYRAALDCVLNLETGISGGKSPLSVPLKHAIFAIIAEKQFDLFAHTRLRITDAVVQLSSQMKVPYISCQTAKRTGRHKVGERNCVKNRKELVAAVTEIFGRIQNPPELYVDWLKEFSRDAKACVMDVDILLDEPLRAWTASNSFKIRGLSEEVVAALKIVFKQSKRNAIKEDDRAWTERWRIVHALGRARSNSVNAHFLSKVVKDRTENQYVRMGAARSLIELAVAVDGKDREKISKTIVSETIAQMGCDISTSSEIEATLGDRAALQAFVRTEIGTKRGARQKGWEATGEKIADAANKKLEALEAESNTQPEPCDG